MRTFSRRRAAAAALWWCASLAAASKPAEPGVLRIAVRPVDAQTPLKAGDFTVTLNGKAAPVLSVRTPEDPQMLLVVLDLAGDITDADSAKAALIEQIQQLPSATYVALLRVTDGATVLVDPTTDRTAVTDAIRASPVTGKAGLFDSLISVETLAENVAKASGVRVATLYVTDSDVRNYREDFANPVINSSDPHDLSRRFPGALIQEKVEKMEKALAARETPVFIVHLRYRTSTLNSAYQAGLKRLAEDTAGWSVFCASPSEIPAGIRQAFATLASQYMLSVALPTRPSAALQIQVETRGTPADLVYRARLFPKQR